MSVRLRFCPPCLLRRFAAALLLGCAAHAGHAAEPAAAATHLTPVAMLAGFTPAAFLQSSRRDVGLALKALAESVGRKWGYAVAVETRLFPTPAPFRAAIEAGEVNCAIFDALTFVSEARWGDLIPEFISATNGTAGRRYLRLVRRDSGLHAPTDLRGKRLVELQTPDLNAGHAWLRSRLFARGVKHHDDFFESIGYVGKASAALVGTVMCASERNWTPREFRSVLLASLGELQLDAAGRQMLSLFKIDQLVSYEAALLAPVRELAAACAQMGPEATS